MLTIRRLVLALLAVIIAVLGCVPAAHARAAVPSRVVAYGYDTRHHLDAPNDTSTERGPPALYRNGSNTYDAIDRRLRGAPARSDADGAGATSSYTTHEPLAADVRATTTTRGQVQVANGHVSLHVTARCAANGGSDVVRHYTTREAAEAITKGGSIEPGAASGKIWLTPDRYASGAEARAKLALNKTPDGYFEIPMCRVRCPSAPGKVEPYYNQPGGGIEITTEFPIDIRGLIFRSFE